MRKKFFLLVFAVSLLIVGCSSNKTDSTDVENTVNNNSETQQEVQVETKKEMYTADMFDELMGTMPVPVIKTKYLVQDDKYKSLYPDMLQAVIKNNTELDIKDVVVAFVAWDKNNLPVKIKGNIDFSDGEYINKVNYSDVNLIPDSEFGKSSGYSLDKNNKIETFKAIVVSYEAFDGSTWRNPYYSYFEDLYGGKKLSKDLNVEVEIVDVNKYLKLAKKEEVSTDIKEEELAKIISSQEVAVIDTSYVIQDEKYKSLYPDMLQAVLKNNTEVDIKDAVVAFVAWDENNLPVKIKGNVDFSEGNYVVLVNYSDINLVPGGEFGKESGYSLKEKSGIKNFKAIVVSYKAFDGSTWENPHYNDFVSLYSGVGLQK